MTARRILWAAVLFLVALLAILAWRLVATSGGADDSGRDPAASTAVSVGPALTTSANPLSTTSSLATTASGLAGNGQLEESSALRPTVTATPEPGNTPAATDRSRRTRPAKSASTASPRAEQVTAPPSAVPASATFTLAASQSTANTPPAIGTPAAASSATAMMTRTPTASPTGTATKSASATATTSPTLPPLATAEPVAANLSGRILLNSQPVDSGVILVLEDTALQVIAETTVGQDGRYQFTNVPAVEDGYTVSFSWDRNDSYDTTQVVAWGWIGPVPFDGQSTVRLPDLDIGLQGLVHNQPEPDTRLSAATISLATPLIFAWDAHVNASAYWVDILGGSSLERLWRADLAPATATEFAGRLDDGSSIQPGAYWWTIGGRSTVDGVRLMVYSHAAGLRLLP